MPDNYIITDDDGLYRRYPIREEPKYEHFWKLENGRKIPSSAAFKTKNGEDGLSVDIASLTTPAKTSGDPLQFGVAEFQASVPLNAGFPCVPDKQPGNDAHALILGDTNPIAKKLSRSIVAIY